MITVTADPDRHLGSALCEICGTPTSVPLTLDLIGVPKGIRTPVTAVKGRCPGPLDDGDTMGSPRSATAAWYAPTPRRAGRGRLHGSRLADNVCGGKPAETAVRGPVRRRSP